MGAAISLAAPMSGAEKTTTRLVSSFGFPANAHRCAVLACRCGREPPFCVETGCADGSILFYRRLRF
jgi:hypothetical protein